MTTVNGFADEPTAQYFHASLYKFTAVARAAVINTFHTRIGNITAKCWYNAKKDIFYLDCPSSKGALCDDHLYDVIIEYIVNELELAEREERLPEVQRFPESKWEWDADRNDGSDYAVEEEIPRVSTGPTVTAHTVIAPDGSKLKFFRMYQLPEAFLRRVLCPRNDMARDVLTRGLTCRTVCWKAREGFVFNGRDGAGHPLNGSSGCPQAELPAFPILSDSRDQATLDALDLMEKKAAPIIRNPVDAWAETVGQTLQAPPDEAADMPKTTKMLLATDEMHGSGRPRVPKGHHFGTTELDLSSDDEPAMATRRPAFGGMLSGGSGPAPQLSGFSDSEYDSGSDRSIQGASRVVPHASFNSPVSKSENVRPPESTRARAGSSFTQTPARPNQSPSHKRTNPAAALSTAVQSTVKQSVTESGELVEYDKPYAMVDHYGLTANPGMTASYAVENSFPTLVKTKHQHVVLRSMKPPAPAGIHVEGSASSVPSNPTTVDSTRAGAPAPWEQNITSGRVPTVELIDARSMPLSKPLAAPPGLMNTSRKDRQVNVASIQQTVSNDLVDAADINLMDRSPPRLSTVGRPHVGQLLQPAVPQRRQAVDPDVAVDKLAVFPPDFTRKRNTMNQKAGNNVKGKGKSKKLNNANGKKPVAQLDLPDPVPPPRAKKVVEVPIPSNRKQGKAASRPTVREDLPLYTNNFQQLLLNTIEKQSLSDNEDDDDTLTSRTCTLAMKFCQLLLLPEEAWLGKQEASTAGVYEDHINSARLVTQHFPRLTTSIVDANRLVQMMGAQTTPDLVYEIRIKDATNRTLVCTIPAASKSLSTVMTSDESSGERPHRPTISLFVQMLTTRDLAFEFVYYPMHVYSARMSLTQPGSKCKSPSHNAVVQFISSMTTDENGPSFHAHYDRTQMNVDAVYANRIFETVKDGITFRVTEKQLLERFEDCSGRYNFRAATFPEEEMVFYQLKWWEAMLETEDLSKRQDLLDIATSMVEKMDDIGSENEGPWGPGQVEGEKASAPVLLYDELGREHLAKLKNQM